VPGRGGGDREGERGNERSLGEWSAGLGRLGLRITASTR